MKLDSITTCAIKSVMFPILCTQLVSCQTTSVVKDDLPTFYDETNCAEYYGHCPKCNSWVKGYVRFSNSWLIAKDGDEEFKIPYGGDSGLCGECPTCKSELRAIDSSSESRLVKWKPCDDKAEIDAIIAAAIDERRKHCVVVREGDSLSKIAKAHGVSVKELAEANKLENPNRIMIGQKLKLPETDPQR